jgi:putative membrane protein
MIALQPLGQLVPLAALALFGLVARGGVSSGLLAVFALSSVVGAALRWSFFRWELTADSLVINEGVVRRQRRVIPLSRIHTVDLARPLWHRVLGVVEVNVETVGGGQTEGKLEALAPQVAAELRADLLGLRDRPTAAQGPAQPPLASLSPRRLVLAGVSGGRIGVAAALVGFATQVLGDRVFRFAEDATGLGITRVVLLIALGLAMVFLISVAATAIAFWGFELRREGTDLTVRRGLLEQRFDTVPLARVQGVVMEENLLRRPFGLASLQVVVAGRAGGDTAVQQALVLPLGTREQALQLAETILDTAGLTSVELTAMPPRARARRIRRAVIATLLVTGTSLVVLGWVGLVGLVTAGLWVPLALAAHRALGHGRVGDVLLTRQGPVVRSTTIVPIAKVQSTAVRATWFQRRLRLASAQVHIATTARSSVVEVVDLDAEDAAAMLVGLLPGWGDPPRTEPVVARPGPWGVSPSGESHTGI